MTQISHLFGGDILFASNGDLDTADGDKLTQQAILRRLMTNPGDYLYHPTYGAGLPQWVGQVIDVQAITAIIRGQILLEPSVAPMPEPVINVMKIQDGISVDISYYDAISQSTQLLSFSVNA